MGSLAEAARTRTDQVRELVAKDVLAWERVCALIEATSNQGGDEIVIRPPMTLNLKATKAASDAMTGIAARGFKVRWDAERDRVSGVEVPVVVVSWL